MEGAETEVPLTGGYERKVMKAVAVEGAWSADGKRLAYRPYIMAYAGGSGWRQHRGGDTPQVLAKVGRQLDSAVGAYNEAIGSFDVM